MRIYDYYETGNGTRVTHSDIQPDGSVRVFFDNADKHAEIKLPDSTIVKNDGFTTQEISMFLATTARALKSIVRYAKEGGVAHAWSL